MQPRAEMPANQRWQKTWSSNPRKTGIQRAGNEIWRCWVLGQTHETENFNMLLCWDSKPELAEVQDWFIWTQCYGSVLYWSFFCGLKQQQLPMGSGISFVTIITLELVASTRKSVTRYGEKLSAACCNFSVLPKWLLSSSLGCFLQTYFLPHLDVYSAGIYTYYSSGLRKRHIER